MARNLGQPTPIIDAILDEFASTIEPEWIRVRNKPLSFMPAPHQHVEADIPELEPLVNLTILFENALL